MIWLDALVLLRDERRTRASSRDIRRLSSYQVKLWRKKLSSFHVCRSNWEISTIIYWDTWKKSLQSAGSQRLCLQMDLKTTAFRTNSWLYYNLSDNCSWMVLFHNPYFVWAGCLHLYWPLAMCKMRLIKLVSALDVWIPLQLIIL